MKNYFNGLKLGTLSIAIICLALLIYFFISSKRITPAHQDRQKYDNAKDSDEEGHGAPETKGVPADLIGISSLAATFGIDTGVLIDSRGAAESYDYDDNDYDKSSSNSHYRK